MRSALLVLASLLACGGVGPPSTVARAPSALAAPSADVVRAHVLAHVEQVWRPFIEAIELREGHFRFDHGGHHYEGTLAARAPTLGTLLRGTGDRCSIGTVMCARAAGGYGWLWAVECWSASAGSDRMFAARADETSVHPQGTIALMTPPEPIWERPPCELAASGQGEVALVLGAQRVEPLIEIFADSHSEDLGRALSFEADAGGLRALDITHTRVSHGVWTASARVKWDAHVRLDEGELWTWRQETTTYDTSIRIGPEAGVIVVDALQLVTVERYLCASRPTRAPIPRWPAPPYDARTGEGCRAEPAVAQSASSS